MMWRETELVDAGRRAGRLETRARARTVVSRRVGVGVARGVGELEKVRAATLKIGECFSSLAAGLLIFRRSDLRRLLLRARASVRGEMVGSLKSWNGRWEIASLFALGSFCAGFLSLY
jgi:hypothetical protein